MSSEMNLITPSMVEAPVWCLDGEAADPTNRFAAAAGIGTSQSAEHSHPALAHSPKGSRKAAQFGPAPAKGGADHPIALETAPSSTGLSSRLAALEQMSPQELREEWRRLYRSQPPRLSPDMLARGLAYRLQEIADGGLSKATIRQLASLAKAEGAPSKGMPAARVEIAPGLRLVREWHGRTHTVIRTDHGFAYGGKGYRSLTVIAREITGAHWSGPRFFGLARTAKGRAGDKLDRNISAALEATNA